VMSVGIASLRLPGIARPGEGRQTGRRGTIRGPVRLGAVA